MKNITIFIIIGLLVVIVLFRIWCRKVKAIEIGTKFYFYIKIVNKDQIELLILMKIIKFAKGCKNNLHLFVVFILYYYCN